MAADDADEHYQAVTCAECMCVYMCQYVTVYTLQHGESSVLNGVYCRKQQHSMAQKEFVCHKLKLLTQIAFWERLDHHLYQKVYYLSHTCIKHVNISPPCQEVSRDCHMTFNTVQSIIVLQSKISVLYITPSLCKLVLSSYIRWLGGCTSRD